MEKSLAEQKKLTSDGCLILSSKENAGSIISTVQYGVIKLMGDDTEYEVSYKTLCDIANKPAQFKGSVVIPELRLKVPLTSIVFQQFREKNVFTEKAYARLPTVDLVCKNTAVGEDFKLSEKSERDYRNSGEAYWRVTAHIIDEGNMDDMRKVPDLKFENVKRALLMKSKEVGYPATILEIYKYGEKQKSL